MEWRIYPNLKDENIDQIKVKDEPYESYILEPGDVIYVPTGMGHQVVVSEPRASLILQANQIQHECSDECRANHK
jgi:ribosomal protein L16 Arg81 hydroxylase